MYQESPSLHDLIPEIIIIYQSIILILILILIILLKLDEHQAHLFLEKKGEAATVVEFRDKMRQIDLDFNRRVSTIEYLLYKYKKTLKELFEAKPNAHLIRMLEEAIDQYQAVFRAKKEREEKIAELERTAASGGANAAKARSEMMALKSHDTAKDSANEISALANKLKGNCYCYYLFILNLIFSIFL